MIEIVTPTSGENRRTAAKMKVSLAVIVRASDLFLA